MNVRLEPSVDPHLAAGRCVGDRSAGLDQFPSPKGLRFRSQPTFSSQSLMGFPESPESFRVFGVFFSGGSVLLELQSRYEIPLWGFSEGMMC